MDNKALWNDAVQLLGEPEVTRRFQRWIRGILNREIVKQNAASTDAQMRKQAEAILQDLNRRTGKNYSLTADALGWIKALLATNRYTVEDFYKVHEVKVMDWLRKPDMRKYLRPSTLYRKSKFDEYLQEWKPVQIPPTPKEVQARKEAEQKKADNAALVKKLLAKPWWDFPTWADFIRHCIKFPGAESYEKYQMPERVRRMRQAPEMNFKVLRGNSPEWAEQEYAQLKKEANNAVV